MNKTRAFSFDRVDEELTYIQARSRKNQKERIVEMARVLGDALQVGASVQSTDPEVLRSSSARTSASTRS